MDEGRVLLLEQSGDLSNVIRDKRFTSSAQETANDTGTDCGIVKQLDALTERRPDLADHIAVIKRQMRQAQRFPTERGREVVRGVLANSVAELKARLALCGSERDGQ